MTGAPGAGAGPVRRKPSRKAAGMVLPAAALALPAAARADEAAVVDAIREYLEFADYGAGVVAAEQILPGGEWRSHLPVDVRSGHLPGAVNIDWREVVGRRDELPRDRMPLRYRDTGMLSAQAHPALPVLGRDGSRVLLGGLAARRGSGARVERE